MNIEKGQLRVWWIPQVPMNPFRQYVESVHEGQLLLNTLAHYDLFQLHNNIKPDYCNAGGLEEWDGNEWSEWSSYDGDDVDALPWDSIAYQHN